MNADNSQDRRPGSLSERTTEIQSPEGLDASVGLSIPTHVAQHPDAPQVAGYVLAELLGEGAYGQVWRAWQIRTRKEVAVKIFKHRSGLDWILLQREVERLMRLDRHPHVVTLLDAGLETDPPYYVIDLIEGGSLQQFVDPASAVPVGRVIAWALEICDALAYVHRKGIIHCDLKPANILVDDEDRVRVVDFGQSRVFNESSASLGTLFFMAPEQAMPTELGRPVQPDVRWDIYAIGGTLYAILTGRVPHASTENARSLEQAASLADRLERYRSMVGTGPLDLRDPVLIERAGPELAAVVAKCLAPRPEDRYESMAELRADLLALQAGRPVSPLAGSHGYRFRKFIRRNPLVVGVFAALVVVAIVAVFARVQSVWLDYRKAQVLLGKFGGAADVVDAAHKDLNGGSARLKGFFSDNAAEAVVSSAFTERLKGARAAVWAAPDAFWKSVDGGPLWRHGEWLEVIDVAHLDPAFVTQHLAQMAAAGSDRQKCVAFCLIGQIAPKDAAVADLCAKAAVGELNPGVAAAAHWAAGRLGRKAPMSGQAFLVDDVSDLTFVSVPGCESFRRGSPPDEQDRYNNENMAPTGGPIQTFFLSTTEVPAGAFTKFVNAPEIVAWLTSDRSAADTETLKLFRRALQSQLDTGGVDQAVGWISLVIANRYCQWLTDKGSHASPPRQYRLPSEDQWEYACRAGNPGPFCFGDNPRYAKFFARCDGAEGGPVVASRMPNFFGLFDMHGNLWEWTDSRFPPELVTEKGLTDQQKKNLYVVRGGAYYSPAVRCRSAQRNHISGGIDGTAAYFGLRIVTEEVQR